MHYKLYVSYLISSNTFNTRRIMIANETVLADHDHIKSH